MTDEEFVKCFYPTARAEKLDSTDDYVIRGIRNDRDGMSLSRAVDKVEDGWDDAKRYIFETFEIEYIEYIVPDFKDFEIFEIWLDKTFIKINNAVVVHHRNNVGR